MNLPQKHAEMKHFFVKNKNIPLLRNHNVYTETGTQICSLFLEKKYDNKLCALLTTQFSF